MNEKIKELAVNSHLHGYMIHLYTIDAPEGYRVPLDIRMEAVEKFAELIVRECIQLIHATTSETIDLTRNLVENASWIENDIKEHFGIEQ